MRISSSIPKKDLLAPDEILAQFSTPYSQKWWSREPEIVECGFSKQCHVKVDANRVLCDEHFYLMVGITKNQAVEVPAIREAMERTPSP